MKISQLLSRRARRCGVRSALLLSCAALMAACAGPEPFDVPDPDFRGRVSLSAVPAVVPGSEVKVTGQNFKPGQEVRLRYGELTLGEESPLVADEDGAFHSRFTVPEDAPLGHHPVVVSVSKPAAAFVQPLKISPDVPLSGEEHFALEGKRVVNGLYQSAYSARSDSLFVTAAVGRPPVTDTQLVKLNPRTLEIRLNVAPRPAPARPGRDGQLRESGLYAVYGVAVDDARGTVWVTNTRHDTVAVYRQSDLALLRQFEAGTVPHARDVVVDEALGRVYVSAVGHFISVFDAESLEFIENIEIPTSLGAARGFGAREARFSPMSLYLDAGSHRLFTVSLSTEEAAVINTRTHAVEKVFVVEGAKTASGVAYDARSKRLLVAAQGSDRTTC